jgi:site-specific recombinase XerD
MLYTFAPDLSRYRPGPRRLPAPRLADAALPGQKTAPEKRLSRADVFKMIRRRAKAAGIADPICCHSFRATGITEFLKNGGTLEVAQAIAAHASSDTTKLYDRRSEDIDFSEVERIRI